MKKLFFLFVAFVATTTLWAHDFEVDGIYYDYLDDNNVKVTEKGSYEYKEYSGAVTIPSTVTYNGTTYNVTSIGNYAFYACRSLTSVTIPESVTSIGWAAFYHCSSLTSITIPNSVTSIGYNAFYHCSSLTSVTIGNSVTSIGDGAFAGCSSLTSVTIPNSVTSIGGGVFTGCSLTSPVYNAHCFAYMPTSFKGTYAIPEGIKQISGVAFGGCRSLTSITIPNSVTSIGSSAFAYCTSLTSITIPDSVTSIGEYAFYECTSLTSITIPEGVTSIGYGAFYHCSSLRTVICEAVEVPELGSYVFSNTPITEATLYVPAQSLDDYKAANKWKDFGRILPLEEAPSAVENTRLPIANGAKLLRDGQLLILKDNKVYTIMGQEIQ